MLNFFSKKVPSPKLIGAYQAFGLIVYIMMIAILFWKGNDFFGKLDFYLGPVLFLTLFLVSALICGLITFAYPIYLFFDQKKTKQALEIVFYTTLWLILFLLIVMFSILIF